MINVNNFLVKNKNRLEEEMNSDSYFKMIFDRDAVISDLKGYVLYRSLKELVNSPGDIAEIGIYKGGSANLLAECIKDTDKTLYLFDSFDEVIPDTQFVPDDGTNGHSFHYTIEEVQKKLNRFNNITIYPGIFPSTAHNVEDKIFCLVHVDCDFYAPILACCEFFYPRMIDGGIMVFDDYEFFETPGATRAVNEFFNGKIEDIFLSSACGGFVVKGINKLNAGV